MKLGPILQLELKFYLNYNIIYFSFQVIRFDLKISSSHITTVICEVKFAIPTTYTYFYQNLNGTTFFFTYSALFLTCSLSLYIKFFMLNTEFILTFNQHHIFFRMIFNFFK